MGLKSGVSRAMLGGLALAWAVPATAQFSDSYNFLKAVRESDGDKATELLAKPGGPVNTRDPGTGETALHIVIKQHNDSWVAYLLSKGAATEIRDRDGNTPLLAAALFGDSNAAALLLRVGAKVDAANSRGETPLILAVQRRDIAMVHQLIEAGANPKIADSFAGKNALQYAADDPRGGTVAKILAEAKAAPAPAISGPVR
jgi:ankyrin repeat protein